MSEQTVDSEAADKQPSTDSATEPPAAPPKAAAAAAGGRWPALLAIVLALAALGAIGWLHYRDDTRRELDDFRVQSLIEQQSIALDQLRQHSADLSANARAAREELAAQVRQLQAAQQAQLQRLEQLTATDRSDWRLAEAEYLLQIANQRVQLGGDPRAALQQLEAADAIVRGIDDSALLPTRTALARDIAALKAVPTVDVDGIYLALDAAARQIAQLKLINPPTLQPGAESPPPPEGAGWGERLQSGLHAAVAKLLHYVQIRRRDQPYQPLLAPEYEAALRQTLQLMVEQAQAALLSGNQQLYTFSLGKASDAVTRYFTVDEQATKAVADTLDELRGRQITAPLPDISASRQALQDYLKTRHDRAGGRGNTP